MLIEAHPRGAYEIKTRRGTTALDTILLIRNCCFRGAKPSLLWFVRLTLKHEQTKHHQCPPNRKSRFTQKSTNQKTTNRMSSPVGFVSCAGMVLQIAHLYPGDTYVCLCEKCEKEMPILGGPLHGKCPECKRRIDRVMKIFFTTIPRV